MTLIPQDDETILRNKIYWEVVQYIEELVKIANGEKKKADDDLYMVGRGNFGIQDDDEVERERFRAQMTAGEKTTIWNVYNNLANHFYKKIDWPKPDHSPTSNEELGMS